MVKISTAVVMRMVNILLAVATTMVEIFLWLAVGTMKEGTLLGEGGKEEQLHSSYRGWGWREVQLHSGSGGAYISSLYGQLYSGFGEKSRFTLDWGGRGKRLLSS